MGKMKRKLTAIFLCVAMCLSSFGSSVLAADFTDSSEENADSFEEEERQDLFTDGGAEEEITDGKDESTEDLFISDPSFETSVNSIWEYYVDEDGCAHITGCLDENSETLTVPVVIDNYPVVAVEKEVFQEQNALKAIKLSFYVTEIDSQAFSNPSVAIRAYEGSYALEYAALHGMPSENLSQYDFTENVLDMTDILPVHYSFINQTDLRMNALEASMLDVGSVFYLPPSEELANGDAFKVLSAEQTTDNQMILRCERALGREVVNSINVNEQNMLPDWDAAVYYYDANEDGKYEEYDYNQIQTYMEVSAGASMTTSKSFKQKVNIFSKENDLASGKVAVDFDVTFDITAAVNANMDIGLWDVDVHSFDVSVTQKTSGTVSVSGKCSSSIPIAEVPLQSVGVATVYAELSIDCSAEGKVACSLNNTYKAGVRYDSAGNVIKPYSNHTKKASVSGQVKSKVGLQLEIGVHIVFLGDVVKMDAKAGAEAVLAVGSKHSDCSDFNVNVYVSITAGTDFSGLPGDFIKNLSVKLTILDKTIPVYSSHFEKSGDEWITVENCKYEEGKCRVSFYTGRSFDIPVQSLVAGSKIAAPKLTEEQLNGDTLLGWNSGSQTVYWDFDNDTVTRDITLFAVWESDAADEYILTYKAEGVADFRQSYREGNKITRPAAPMRMNYMFWGWYADPSFERPFDFESTRMPASDMTLYGRWEYRDGYNPWSLTGNETNTASDFLYKVKNGNAVITAYTGKNDIVKIPSSLDGYPVVSIGENAFYRNTWITEVAVPSTVHSIETYAFGSCTYLKKIELPDTIEKIENQAFSNCPALTEISLPAGLTEIASKTFAECTGLVSVSFPEKLTVIGFSAFEGCSSLESVCFPQGMKKIYGYAFSGCTNLDGITLPDNLETLSSNSFKNTAWEMKQPDGMIYLNKALYKYKGEMPENASVSVREGTTLIAENAFSNSPMSEIILPQSITKVGSGAFSGCSKINRIVLNNSVDIGSIYSNAESMDLVFTDKVTEIPSDFFTFNSANVNIYIGKNVKKIGSMETNSKAVFHYGYYSEATEGNICLYYNAENCESISPNLLNYYSSKPQFSCRLMIGSEVVRIPEKAFYYCSYLEDVDASKAAALSYIGMYAFNGTGWYKENEREETGIVYMGNCLYRCFGKLEGNFLEIRPGTTMVCDHALNEYSSSDFCEIIFPDSLQVIGNYAFYGRYTNVVTLPESVEEIGSYAFRGRYGYGGEACYSIYLPPSVKSIGEYAIGVPSQQSINGNIYCKPGSYAETYAKQYGYSCHYMYEESPYLALDSSREYLKDLVYGVTSVNLPYPVTKADSNAFTYGVQSYGPSQKIVLEDIKELTIQNNVQSGFSFSALNGVTSVTLGSAVSETDYDFLNAFPKLERVNVSDGNNSYEVRDGFVLGKNGTWLLFYNGNEKNIRIPDTVEVIGCQAFANKGNITVRMSENVGSIAETAFANSDPEIISAAGSYAQDYASKKGYRFQGEGEAVKQMEGCNLGNDGSVSLDKESGLLTIYGKVPWVNGTGFGDLLQNFGRSIRSVYFASNARQSDYFAELVQLLNMKCENLTEIRVDEENTDFVLIDHVLYSADKETLLFCPRGITEVAVFDGTKRIEDNAFLYHRELTSVTFPETLRYVGYNAFERTGIVRAVLPKQMKEISSGAFFYCEDLEYVALGEAVTYLYGSFEYCRKLTSIHIPPSVIGIYGSEFANCSIQSVTGVEGTYAQKWAEEHGYSFNGSKLSGSGLYNDFYYNASEGEIVITGISSQQKGSVCIPDSVYGLPVTEIAPEAFRGNNRITRMTIPASVNQIGERAFSQMYALNSISVDAANMNYCTEDDCLYDKDKTCLYLCPAGKYITSYTAPESLKVIAEEAFYGCSSLKTAVLNENLETIGSKAFYDCTMLTAVAMPSTLAQVGDWAFWNTGNIHMTGPVGECVASQTAARYHIDYNIYQVTMINDGKKVMSFKQQAGTGFANPLGETSRDDYTLTGWYTEEALTSLWDFESDTMPAEDLKLYAGWTCDYQYESTENGICITGVNTRKKYYTIPGSLDGKKVTAIAARAFASEDIRTVRIPSTVTEIAEDAFSKGTTLYGDAGSEAERFAGQYGFSFGYQYYTAVFDSNGGSPVSSYSYRAGEKISRVSEPIKDNYIFTGWYKESSLENLWDFEKDVMPESGIKLYAGWKKINSNLQENCFTYVYGTDGVIINGYTGNLEKAEIPQMLNGASVTGIADMAFMDCSTMTEIVIPNGVKSIGDYAFSGCANLKKVSLPNTVISVGEYAFSDCISIHTFSFSENMSSVSEGMLQGCRSLREVNIPSSVETIAENAFHGCQYLENIILNSGLVKIGKNAFYGCRKLAEISIPDTVSDICTDSFDACTSLQNIRVERTNREYQDMDGVLFDSSKSSLLRYPEGKRGDSYQIPDGVCAIGEGAFLDCGYLENIAVSDDLAVIGQRAFYNCRNLVSIDLSKTEVDHISEQAFAFCKSLEECILPEQVCVIGKGAWWACSRLETLEIPSGAVSIFDDSFLDCGKIRLYCGQNMYAVSYAKEHSLDYYYIPVIPDAPQILLNRPTKVVLKETEGCEYSIDGENWQTSAVFDTLQSEKEYTFYQRAAEEEHHPASGMSEGTSITTLPYISVKDCTIHLDEADYSYTGMEIHPAISVEYEGMELVQNTDYTLAYTECVNAGTGFVTIAGINDFCGEAEKTFHISKAQNDWLEPLTCSNIYPEQIPSPHAKPAFGEVVYTYAAEENGTYTSEIPKNVGVYYVRAEVLGGDNYTGLSSSVPFEIQDYHRMILGENQILVDGQKISMMRFIPSESGIYVFYSIGSKDTCGYLYDSDKSVIDFDDDSGEGMNFSITENLEAGEVYYVGIRFYSDGQEVVTVAAEKKTVPVVTPPPKEDEDPVTVLPEDKEDSPGTVPPEKTEVSPAPSLVKTGETVTIGSLKYRVTKVTSTGGMVSVIAPKTKSVSSVSIPAEVKIHDRIFLVTEISEKAFRGCTKLKKATIGENVSVIGKEAFYGCTALKTINMKAASLKKVGADAFKKINNAANIQIPSGKMAAYTKLLSKKGQSSKTKITYAVPSKNRVFTSGSLKYVVTKSSAKNGTVSVKAPKSKGIKTVSIPATVKLDGYTFKVTAVSDKAFLNCKKLKKAILGSNLTSIGKEAFRGCKALKNITIKTKLLKKVGKNALKNIHSKVAIKVPSSKLKAYKKLLKGKGQNQTVKIGRV